MITAAWRARPLDGCIRIGYGAGKFACDTYGQRRTAGEEELTGDDYPH
jgi:hypothetical protein